MMGTGIYSSWELAPRLTPGPYNPKYPNAHLHICKTELLYIKPYNKILAKHIF